MAVFDDELLGWCCLVHVVRCSGVGVAASLTACSHCGGKYSCSWVVPVSRGARNTVIHG